MKLIFLVLVCVVNAPAFSQREVALIQREYDSLTSVTVYGRSESAGQYYNIRGIKMYCEVYGSGEPLLLIHGGGGSINNFVLQIPFFAQRYKVIVADSRSHGRSEDKADSLSYEMMADDYAELISQLGIDSANIIGWSDGGIIGLLLAIRYPEKVKKLIISGANLRPDTSAVSPDIHQRVLKTYNTLKQKKEKSQLDKRVFKYFRLLVEQPDIKQRDLQKVKIPTLVVAGDHDVIQVRHTVDIFSNLQKSYLWIVPNSGHSALVVYSDEFNKKANTFLQTPYRRITDRDRYF
jgi:pimeloyl-ACP methyl ester carboxylesterase